MARKSRRSSSRKMKHTRKHKTHRRRTHRRRTHRRRGGADALSGAPVNYHLSGDWSSRMSLGQGADYFKYHEGQHGGAALGMGPFPAAVLDPGLPQDLRGPAHIGGIDKAIADVRGLCDPPNCPGTTSVQPAGTTTGGRRGRRNNNDPTNPSGNNSPINIVNNNPTAPNDPNGNNDPTPLQGGRRHRRHSKKHHKSRRHSKKHRKTHRRHRRSGGALGYAPFPSPGMLLSSPKAYAEAGLNPEWKTDVAFTDAKIRETQ